MNYSAQSNNVCVNSEVLFVDASENVNSWQWQFPGGSPATSFLKNPNVIYHQPGIFNVMLTVTNSHGSQTAMRLNYITVNAPPALPSINIMGNELQSTPAIQYQWLFNDVPIPAAVSWNYMATTDGYYTVQVQDIHQCSSVSKPVYFSSTSVDEKLSSKFFLVYPNPAKDKLNILIPENSEGKLSIINMNGQCLFEKKIRKDESKIIIDQIEYPTGIYTVLLINDNGQTLKKIISIN